MMPCPRCGTTMTPLGTSGLAVGCGRCAIVKATPPAENVDHLWVDLGGES